MTDDEIKAAQRDLLREALAKGLIRVTSYTGAFTAKQAREALEKALASRE